MFKWITQFNRLPLGRRLILVQVLLMIPAIVFTMLAGVFVDVLLVQQQRARMGEQRAALIEQISENTFGLDRDFLTLTQKDSVLSLLKSVSPLNPLGDMTPQLAVTRELREFMEMQQPLFHQIRILTSEGQEILRIYQWRSGPQQAPNSELGAQLSGAVFVEGAINAERGEFFISSVEFDEVSGREEDVNVIYYAQQIYENGNPRGILVAEVLVEDMLAPLYDNLFSQSDAFVVDEKNRFIFHTNENLSQSLLHQSGDYNQYETLLENTDENMLMTGGAHVAVAEISPPGASDSMAWHLVIIRPWLQQVTLVSGIFVLLAVAGVATGLTVSRNVIKNFLEKLNEMESQSRLVLLGQREPRMPKSEGDELGTIGRAFNIVAEELDRNNRTFARQVAQQTRDLEAAAQIGRVAVGLRDLDTLLRETVNLIQRRFGFYHAQVFIVDEARRYAVLRESTGEAGKKLLEIGHKLPVGSRSVIGQVTTTGEHVIAWDTEDADVVHRPNPYLPETRSEMALPLKIGDEIVGALDIQSTKPRDFTEDNVRILGILGDLLAIAIDNARLIADSQAQLERNEALTEMLTEQAWEGFLRERREQLAYTYDLMNVHPLEETGNNGNGGYEVPIQVRGGVVGALHVQPDEADVLGEDDHVILGAVAERVGLAIENARLIVEAQESLAETERLYTASRTISTAPSLETIYRFLVEELAKPYDIDRLAVLFAGPESSIAASYLDYVYIWNRDGTERPPVGTRLAMVEIPITLLFEDEHEVLRIDNIHEDPRLDEETRQQLAQYFLPGVIFIPLISGTDWLGLVACESSFSVEAFTNDYVQYATALVGQASITLDNRRLVDEAQSEARRARALADASQSSSQIGVDFETGISNLFQSIAEPGNFDRFWVALLSSDGRSLQNTIYDAGTGQVIRQNLPLNYLTGSSNEAFKNQRPVIINDPIHDPRHVDLEEEERIARGKHIALPIASGEEVIGVMSLGRSIEEPDLDVKDLDLGRTVASQIAVAAQNRRLFEQAQNERERLQSILDTMPTGVVVVDGRTLDVTLSNRRAMELLGEKVREAAPGDTEAFNMVETEHSTIYAEDDLPLVRVITTGESATADNIAILREDGGRVEILNSAAPIFDESGMVSSVVAVYQDITELRNLEHQLQNTLEETGVLYRSSRAIADAQKIPDVLSAIIQNAAQADIDRGFIFLLSEQGQDITQSPVQIAAVWDAESGIGTSKLPAQTIRDFSVHQADETLVMLEQGEFVVSDVATTSKLSENSREAFLSLGLGAFIAFPLETGGRHVGVFMVGTSYPRIIDEREIRVYRSLMDEAAVTVNSIRLREQTERRARQLTASAEVARAITSVLQLDELFPRIVDTIRDSFNYDHVQIFIVQGNLAVLRASTGEAGEKLLQMRHSLAVGSLSVIGRVTESGEPNTVMDTEESETHRPNPLLPDTRSEMALPLVGREGQILGALDLQSNQPRAFSDEDVAVLSGLADQIATAIDNAGLYEEAERNANEMGFLFSVTQRVTRTSDLNEAIQSVSDILYDALDVLDVAVMLPDEEIDGFRVAAHTGITRESEIPQIIHAGEGVVGWVIENAAPALVPDVSKDPRYNEKIGAVRSELAMPLMQGDNVIGIINIESGTANGLTQEDLNLLQILSGTLSAIIQSIQLLNEVQAANDQLKELDQLKNQFLANMSHELRTPLNSIIGFSRVMLKGIDGPLTDMQTQDLETIHSSGNHLLRLINDILDQSKIAAGKMELSFDWFEVSEVVKGVASTMVGYLRDKPVKLIQEIQPDLPQVWGDEFRTRQVLLNIGSNAAKFTEEGTITFKAYLQEDAEGREMVHVSITDTGIGIAPENIDRVFEAFRQVDSSTTRKVGGTGLGMPISKQLVEMQGGQLWVESQVNKGSTFTFTVPLSPEQLDPEMVEQVAEELGIDVGEIAPQMADAPQMAEEGASQDADQQPEEATAPQESPEPEEKEEVEAVEAESTNGKPKEPEIARSKDAPPPQPAKKPEPQHKPGPARTPSPGKNVVVAIEDEDGMVNLYRRYLGRLGYDVIGVPDPRRAEEMVALNSPRFVLLDINMPERDGWEVLYSLKTNDVIAQVPVIVCSIIDEVHKGMDLGADAYLVKPFREDELAQTVEEVLEVAERPRILIVDDQPDSVDLIKKLLEEQDKYKIMQATSGEEGLRILYRNPKPNLIILDLRMPEIDGFEFLRRMRERPDMANIPTIIVTADEIAETEREQLDDLDIYQKAGLSEETLLVSVGNYIQR